MIVFCFLNYVVYENFHKTKKLKMDEYKKIVRDYDADQKNKKAKQKMRQENAEKRVILSIL